MAVGARFFLIVSVMLGLAGAAEAASVTLQGVTGTWTGVQGGKSVTGLGTDRIEWGNPVGQDRKSGYGFNSAATAAKPGLIPGERFALGTFTHFNHAIAVGSGAKGAQLDVDIDVMIGSSRRSLSTSFDFAHLETRNQDRGCANGGANGGGVNANGCADRVTAVGNEETSQTFTVDGVQYAFTISGFEDMDEFWTMENADNSAMLYGRFTQLSGGGGGNEPPPSPVPLPASGWLLVGGVAGIGTFLRRRSRG